VFTSGIPEALAAQLFAPPGALKTRAFNTPVHSGFAVSNAPGAQVFASPLGDALAECPLWTGGAGGLRWATPQMVAGREEHLQRLVSEGRRRRRRRPGVRVRGGVCAH
jgi:hypothetical protein